MRSLFSLIACGVPLLAIVNLTLPGLAQIQPASRDPRVEELVTAVSSERLEQAVRALAGFGTRHTLSDTTSATRGIGAARQWILEELQRSSPRLQVSFDVHRLARSGRITRNIELRNVLAVLPGRSARRIYVGAHYDTVNVGDAGQIGVNTRAPGQPATDVQLRADQNYDVDAPGANDNASGSAIVIELARVLASSGLEFDATLVFALWAGEEQGLFGSRAHVERLAAGRTVVDAVFNNDIVGNSRGGDGVADGRSVRVYSEGPEDSTSRALARFIRQTAGAYVPSHRVQLMARVDRFNRGSDHSSFNAREYPAITFRESKEDFSRQHAAADTADGVDFVYLTQNARVNAAAVASLALAPAGPRVTDQAGRATIGRQPSGYDAHLRWTPSTGATGYRVYWRKAWTPDWEQSRSVGDASEFTLPGLSIDDHVFGVATLGPNGEESTISSYVETRAERAPLRLRR